MNETDTRMSFEIFRFKFFKFDRIALKITLQIIQFIAFISKTLQT